MPIGGRYGLSNFFKGVERELLSDRNRSWNRFAASHGHGHWPIRGAWGTLWGQIMITEVTVERGRSASVQLEYQSASFSRI